MDGKNDGDWAEAHGVHGRGGAVHFTQELGEETSCSTPA